MFMLMTNTTRPEFSDVVEKLVLVIGLFRGNVPCGTAQPKENVSNVVGDNEADLGAHQQFLQRPRVETSRRDAFVADR